jgi:hypothetical protein
MTDGLHRSPLHFGYLVEDIEAAAQRLATAVGAGPFLHIGHVKLAVATYRGEPAVYDHSTAFGQWGPTVIEISQIHHAEPAGLREFFTTGPPPAIGHVAWMVDDLEAESTDLERQGLALVHTGTSGPVTAHWHDGGTLFGHPIEVHRRGPGLIAFNEAIGAASRNWDGSRPLRDAPGPPPS